MGISFYVKAGNQRDQRLESFEIIKHALTTV